jgi:hypothetical protein
VPVIQPESAPARKTIASTTSSGVPWRPSGWNALTESSTSRASSGDMNRSYAGVSTNASATVLILIWSAASSIARFLVRTWRPACAVE